MCEDICIRMCVCVYVCINTCICYLCGCDRFGPFLKHARLIYHLNDKHCSMRPSTCNQLWHATCACVFMYFPQCLATVLCVGHMISAKLYTNLITFAYTKRRITHCRPSGTSKKTKPNKLRCRKFSQSRIINENSLECLSARSLTCCR